MAWAQDPPASKAELIELPAALAGQMGSSAMPGKLAQVGANSVLLKFSRTAESEADLMALI